MRSEPPDTAWGLLSERLRVFAEDAGAPNAIVFDSSGTILCRGHRPDEPQHVRIGSLVVVMAAVLKVFLVDMDDLTGLWRVASFFGLGLALVGIGFLYQRLVFVRPATDTGATRP